MTSTQTTESLRPPNGMRFCPECEPDVLKPYSRISADDPQYLCHTPMIGDVQLLTVYDGSAENGWVARAVMDPDPDRWVVPCPTCKTSPMLEIEHCAVEFLTSEELKLRR